GYGKRTDILEYLRGDSGVPQNRGGVGLKNYNITEKTGSIAGVLVVDETDDILLISDDGTIIRMATADISKLSRGTQGVRLMRLGEDAKVISIARTEPIEEDPDAPPVGDDAHIVPPSDDAEPTPVGDAPPTSDENR
ncbi:MAG: DNA gyrase subunit A, partial [Oscillospiraceae bacterium]|nr:DNA gyrase subunit A [Oscillospiraceae bacterium]